MIGGAAGSAANPELFKITFMIFFLTSIFMWAIKISQGKSSATPSEVSQQLIKYVLVATSSLAFAFPSQTINIAWLVSNFPEMLGSLLGVGTGAPAQLDAFFGKSYGILRTVFSGVATMGIDQIGSIIIAVLAAAVLLIVSIVVCIVAMGAYLVAKVAIFLGTLFAPISILCLLVPATQQYFSRWVGFMVGNAVLLVIISALLGILLGGSNTISDGLFEFEEVTYNTCSPSPESACDPAAPENNTTTQQAKNVNLEALIAAIILYAITGLLLSRGESFAQALSDNAGASSQGFASGVIGGTAAVAGLGIKAAAATARGAQGASRFSRGMRDSSQGKSDGRLESQSAAYRVGQAAQRRFGNNKNQDAPDAPTSGGSVRQTTGGTARPTSSLNPVD